MTTEATQQNQVQPLLLNIKEAAKAMRICERTLFSLTKGGGIPCLRIGKRILYSPADLQKWVEDQKGRGKVEIPEDKKTA